MNLPARQLLKATRSVTTLSKAEALTVILLETTPINFLRRLSTAINSRLGINASAFYLLCVIGQLTWPTSSFAQYCIWPTITVVWSGIGPEQYTDGSGFGYGITRPCPTDCCRDVTFLDRKIIVDGNEVAGDGYSQPLAEGSHSATAKFTASGGEENIPYNVSTSFYVDKTPPVISLTKPKNNISIPITDASMAGSVSDADAKLNLVEVSLSVSSPCRFYRDFSGATVNLGTISGKYCDADYYLPAYCIYMGSARASFALNYNLREYVDFPEGQDCGFYFQVGAIDRVANGSLGSDSTAFNYKSISFSVDQAPPVVTINKPVVAGSDMYWGNADAPVISGIARDLSEITKVWLTIKDERAGKWWTGSKWDAKIATLGALIKGTTAVTWDYNLPQETLRSGVFTITAYASDKFGHEGYAVVSGKNKKKSGLGENKYTEYSIEFPNFTVSYGQTKNLCAIVMPSQMKSILSSKLTYEINPPGVFEISAGPGCDGISLAVKSNKNVCLAQGNVAVKIDGEAIASAIGTIILPTSDFAVYKDEASPYCNPVMGCIKAYNVYMKGASGMDLTGLFANEHVTNLRRVDSRPLCKFHLQTSEETPQPIGHDNTGYGIGDVLAVTGGLTSCAERYDQFVTVEACPVQKNVLNFEVDAAGNIKLSRSDEKKQ